MKYAANQRGEEEIKGGALHAAEMWQGSARQRIFVDEKFSEFRMHGLDKTSSGREALYDVDRVRLNGLAHIRRAGAQAAPASEADSGW